MAAKPRVTLFSTQQTPPAFHATPTPKKHPPPPGIAPQTDEDTVYTLYPRINTTACDVDHSAAGPTLAKKLLRDAVSGRLEVGWLLCVWWSIDRNPPTHPPAPQPLPSLDEWRFAGETVLRGQDCEVRAVGN